MGKLEIVFISYLICDSDNKMDIGFFGFLLA